MKFSLSAAIMGKRNSTAVGAAADAAAKKAKTTDADPPAVGNWVQTKIGDRELASAEKISLLKNDPVEVLAAGPKNHTPATCGLSGTFPRIPPPGLLLSPASFPSRSPFCLRDSASRSKSQHYSAHRVFHHTL
jgi:hypothetical protein